ncbi:MAG: alpha/beta fold hydrolase [Solirubrobacteraceae bacterium]
MRIPIHDRGGSGPPLVISHATGFCGRLYDPLAAALSDRFRVFAVDHRGHGEAGSPPDGDMSYQAMAVDLIDAIESLDLEAPRVFGHSMGATVALLAAQRRPELFSRAYLFEASALPTAFRVNGATNAMIEGVRRRIARFPSKPEALANFAAKDPYRRFRADALACFVEHALVENPDGGVRLRCTPTDEAECYLRNMISVVLFAGF